MKGTKLVKDNDIDKEATMKFVDLSVTDGTWKPIYKMATEECLKELDETFPAIEKKLEMAPFNIKKDQCNAKHMELVSCIESQVFMKIAECFMNDMQLAKFNDIDKNEVLNYIVEAPNDAAWKQIYGNAFEQCYNDINVRFSEVVTLFEFPPFNIRRDQCNVKFMALLMCIKHKVLSVTIS
ncbi:unnamed protein product [Diamesa serratosioi]